MSNATSAVRNGHAAAAPMSTFTRVSASKPRVRRGLCRASFSHFMAHARPDEVTFMDEMYAEWDNHLHGELLGATAGERLEALVALVRGKDR